MAGKHLSLAQKKSAQLLREAKTADKTLAIISAEDMGMTPLLPQNLTAPNLYRNDWFNQNSQELFEIARRFLGENDFFGGVHYIKHTYFSDGFQFLNRDKPTMAWIEAQSAGYDFNRLAADIWTEWLMCDNVVALWFRPKDKAEVLPKITILDCEIVRYTDVMGIEVLKIKLPPNSKLDAATMKALGARWGDAIKNGKTITIDPRQGEFFKVLTREKFGKGMGKPRLGQIMSELSTLDLLEIADWSAAWSHKNVVRQIMKGHAITHGTEQGSTKHFLTVAQQKRILQQLNNKAGAHDVVTNFDLKFVYNFLDPRFFDNKKYQGVMERLSRWAGAAGSLYGSLYQTGIANPNLMDAFAAEGRANRSMVGNFINSILNDANFRGAVEKPPAPLKVGWNLRSFMSMKFILEQVRLGLSQGIMSPQTAQAMMDLDSEIERENMEEAHANVEDFTPVFQPSQGQGQEPTEPGGGIGGAPSDKTDTTTKTKGSPKKKK